MKKGFLSRNLPHIVAVVFFFVLSVYYSSPVLDNKELVGHDTESWIGMSKETIDFNRVGSHNTAWTSRMFCGMPTYQISVKNIPSVISIVEYTLYKLPRVVFTVFLYLLGSYILLILFGINPWMSLVYATALAFCSYNFIILAVGHNTKALAIAYMAPLIGSIVYAFRKDRLKGALFTMLFLSLAISANHVQILYYTLITLIVFGVSEFVYVVKNKQIVQLLKTLGCLLVVALISVGVNANILLPTKEYSEYTMRGKSNGLTLQNTNQQVGLDKDYITNWSYGIDETLTLLIPNFKGGASSGKIELDSPTAKKLRAINVPEETISSITVPMYWGTQPGTSGPVYVGAIVCLLFFLGICIVPGRDKYWLIGATVLSILLSWGRNFMPFTDVFIDYVPLYNMFRAVSMTLVITCFCMVLLGGLALKNLLYNDKIELSKKKKSLGIATGITAGICLFFSVAPGIVGDFKTDMDATLVAYGYPDFFVDTLPLDREALLRSDALRSLFFVIAATVVLYLTVSKKIKMAVTSVALGILLLLDLVPIAKRYLNDDMFSKKKINYEQPTVADQYILDQKSNGRVLNLTVDVFNSSKPSYFHKNIGGYHAAKLRRYQELIDCQLNTEIKGLYQAFSNASTAEPIFEALSRSNVLNMLNLKYLIYSPEATPIENPFNNGCAWFVEKYNVVNSADEEMTQLGKIDTKTELVVDKEYIDLLPKKIEKDSTASITVEVYEPNRIRYRTNAQTTQLAIFSEIFYDAGWIACVDGKEKPYFRANYLLRAMEVEAGEHTIEFKFEPKIVVISNVIVVISSLLFVLLFGLYFFLKNKKKNVSQY